MDLHTAGHRQGLVCAPHSAAVEAGRAVLAEGGNALEAMVAMAAMIAAVYPHMNHIGGDGFWLVREPSGRSAFPFGRVILFVIIFLVVTRIGGGRGGPRFWGGGPWSGWSSGVGPFGGGGFGGGGFGGGGGSWGGGGGGFSGGGSSGNW